MRVKDKRALVSGAASGIGEAIARTLAREGARVVIADIDEAGGARVRDAIRAAGGTAEYVRADILDSASIEAMVASTVDHFGGIDVLVNNAQVTAAGRLGEIELAAFRRALDGGLTSYWYASKLAVAHMLRQGGGAIVNIASVSGLAGDFGLGPYNAAKAGVVNITRVFGIEYARKGIRCNAVCPGPIASPGLKAADERGVPAIQRIKEAIPMGRLGTPQEMANIALFLASDEASFVTGAAFVGDGGLYAHSGMPTITGITPDFQ